MAKITINIGTSKKPRTVKQPVVWTPIDKMTNFKYDVDYDFDDEVCHNFDCDHEYGRCRTIENIRFNSVDIPNIMSRFIGGSQKGKSPLVDDVFLKYALYRVMVHSQLWNDGLWETYPVGGYYGEEMGPVTLDSQMIAKFNAFIVNNKSLSDNEKIRNALIVEYGYILEALEGKDLNNIKKVKIDDIHFGQKDHYVKINIKEAEQYYSGYENLELPFGICIDEGDGKYRLIDGYHRVAYAKNKKLSKVPMIVVE